MNFRQNVSGKQALLAVAGLILFVIVIVQLAGHNSSTPAPASAASASTTGSAQIVMLHGPNSDNSCAEEDGEARIYVIFTLRNTGNADGTVNPWATFDYSDGGHSTESYVTNFGHELTVPAHTEVDASFYHTFNPQQHWMIRCAGYPDLSSEGGGYYLPMS